MPIKLLKPKRQENPDGEQSEQQVLANGAQQNGASEHEHNNNSKRSDEHSHQRHDAHETAAATTTTTATSTTTTTTTTSPDDDHYEAPLVWRNIILFIILHSAIPASLYMVLVRGQPQWKTLTWTVVCMYTSGLGITGGAHRLWSHRAYKARAPMQIMFMLLQTMAGQNSIYTWSRDHRVHHKYSETHADPHNIKRGFFFAHMGWLCCRKHPDVRLKGALIDMSDLEANPVVMFQHRHFWWLATMFTVLLPTMVPVWLWQEAFWPSFVFSFMIRYLISLHGTWLVNSAAHYWGSRPYDTHIEARESPLVILSGLGEGFHNYHHTFPFDYSTSEFGKYFNMTTAVIDLFVALGLASDRRQVDKETIMKRRMRTGEPMKTSSGGTGTAASGHQQANGGSDGKAKQRAGLKAAANGQASAASSSSSLRMDIIHELPYISGLTSMKYTM